MNYRLYTFVANHYISPLQCGLQTAHVVSELSRFKINTPQATAFNAWAATDKTIIICGAGNHGGVMRCYAELVRTGGDPLQLPVALFREDEESMNGMATACGVIVPEQFWDVKFNEAVNLTSDQIGGRGYQRDAFWSHKPEAGEEVRYSLNYPEGQFINHIKQYRLA